MLGAEHREVNEADTSPERMNLKVFGGEGRY